MNRGVAVGLRNVTATSWRMTVLPSDFARPILRKMCARLVGTAWVIAWNIRHSVDEDEAWLKPFMGADFAGSDFTPGGCGNEAKRD